VSAPVSSPDLAQAIRAALQSELAQFQPGDLAGAASHLIGQGKLFRPRLQLACYTALTGQPAAQLAGLAAPIELVHTFTLIHDDLPCMDNASLRRGLPSVHIQYGEANAVLAGDALLNLAYLSLARSSAGLDSPRRLKLLQCLGQAVHDVIEGQALDMLAEGQELALEQVQRIHRLKTAALISAACEMGAIMAGGGSEATQALAEFGLLLGALFQAQDDLLSVHSDTESSGKTLSSDEDKLKATLPRVIGTAATVEYVRQLKERVAEALAQLVLLDRSALESVIAELNDR